MRFSGHSLLFRVFLLHAAVLCLAGIVVPLVIDAMLRERTEFFERRVLGDRAAVVTKALARAPDGALVLGPSLHAHDWEDGEFIYAVLDKSGAVRLASTPSVEGTLAALPREGAPAFSTIVKDGASFDAISQPVSLGDANFWVAVGWDLSKQDVIFDDVVQGFLGRALAVTAPLLALLLVLDGLMVRHFFRPVLRVSQQVQALDPTRSDARLPALDLPAEIQPLATAFNAALKRAEQGYRLQKEFTADAAHELRTPMAVLDARLQTLPASETRTALLGDVKLMTRIITQLLDMAVLDQESEATEATDLVAVCQSVLAALAPEAIAKRQTLGLTELEGLSSLPVLAREQDVWHMLRNLVENAIRHTPAGTSIDVALAADGTLTVQDDGPGIPEDLQEHIFKRFWRRKRSGGSGAGLGMAIVQKVVTSNGGSITLRSSEGKGAAFVIRLPLAKPSSLRPEKFTAS